MVKILFASLIILTFLVRENAYAQTPTSSPTPSPKSSPTKAQPTTSITNSDQIEKIKDIVASRAAELKLVDRRGVLGEVENVTSSQITMKDIKNKKRIIEIDEITKFYSPTSKTFGISDIKKGDRLGVIGLFNKNNDKILSRVINKISSTPTRIKGTVTNVNKNTYQINVATDSNDKKVFDIETSTKIFSFTKDTDQIKSGFSKINTGELIYGFGYEDLKDKNLINLDRLIHFPKLSKE